MSAPNRNVFRIYYHLYLGNSWKSVWALHRPLLESFAASGALDRLIVCVCGGDLAEIPIASTVNVEVRRAAGSLRHVNEFHTLRELQCDATDLSQSFTHCAYLHSKGASSQRLGLRGEEWSIFLAKALLGAMRSFPEVVEAGFNTLGSNLSLGLFEDFEGPRLHYSGNFWCATRALVASAPDITLGTRYTAVRHNAEWWLSRAHSFTPYNVFCTGVDHYAAGPNVVNWERLEFRLAEFGARPGSPTQMAARIEFMRTMMQAALGRQYFRRHLSNFLLGTLPHHRWRRLLNLHDVVMRQLGSRKSVYFFCPEST